MGLERMVLGVLKVAVAAETAVSLVEFVLKVGAVGVLRVA